MTLPGPRLVQGSGGDPDELRELVGALFREHYAGLCGFVVRYVKSMDVAEEAVQEIFLRVWGQCEGGAAVLPTRAYLYAAARNQALTLIRHDRVVQRHVALHASGVAPAPMTPTADAALELDELTQAAQKAIAGLPERARQVFLLSRERKLTYAEIGEVLGISIKTVEANMARALKRLRASLEGLAVIGLVAQATLRLFG